MEAFYIIFKCICSHHHAFLIQSPTFVHTCIYYITNEWHLKAKAKGHPAREYCPQCFSFLLRLPSVIRPVEEKQRRKSAVKYPKAGRPSRPNRSFYIPRQALFGTTTTRCLDTTNPCQVFWAPWNKDVPQPLLLTVILILPALQTVKKHYSRAVKSCPCRPRKPIYAWQQI